MSDESNFRAVNATLGNSPSVGPLPGNQFIPWTVILVLAWFIGQGLLGLGMLKTAFLAAWLIGSWWILTGSKPWRYLSKLMTVPDWTVGYIRYFPLLKE